MSPLSKFQSFTHSKSTFLRIGLAVLFLKLSTAIFAATVSEQIIVDQIGYRPNSDKWFMIADPQIGQNSNRSYAPGATVELRRSSDNAVVKTITLSRWNGGATHEQSGDKVWQGQFSDVTAEGSYYIYDPTNDTKSWDFEIGSDIYNDVLEASVKTYYYQRSGTAITSQYGGQWTHPLAHVQNQQASRLYDASMGGAQGTATARDITGGWYDAGDYRKYTSWMADVIWDIGTAYEWWPEKFSDTSNIPESGNGVPDVLDELKWEVDWMLKMQREDGALYSGCFVVSGDNGTGDGVGDPSTENRNYYYANISTTATSSGAISFAILSRLIAPYESTYPGYAAQLRAAAEKAWSFLQANPGAIHYDHTNFDNANANKSNESDLRGRVAAAAELFRLTGDTSYRNYFDANYDGSTSADTGHHPIKNGYFETGVSFSLQRGMVTYALTNGASASVVSAIHASLEEGISRQTLGQQNSDPYKCFMWDGHYTWGSNALKAQWAMLAIWGAKLGVNPTMSATYQRLAEEYVHYYFGRNPLSWSYITQSQLYGADKPITRMYHGWFHHGTQWEANPAPGYIVGGPNQSYEPDPSYNGVIDPPENQPAMKSYKDWNVSWPQNSWSVTENSTGYQSRFTFLVAAFSATDESNTSTEEPNTNVPDGYVFAPLYRFHRTDNNSHFFTAIEAEKNAVLTNLPSDIWKLEGVSHHVLLSQPVGALPVYRLFNKVSGAHFYTMTVSERDNVLSTMPNIFSLEGVGFYALSGPVGDAKPVYRFYAPRTGSHFFTISEAEKDWIRANISTDRLNFEGIAWWAFE